MDRSGILERTSSDFYKMITMLHRNIFDFYNNVRKLSIPMSHFKVLFYMYRKRECIISDIAESLSIVRSNLTPVLESLCSEGYLEKKTNPKDKRYYIMSMTEEGDRFLEENLNIIKDGFKEKLSLLSDDDLELLSSHCEAIMEIIGKLSDAGDGK